MEIKKIRYVSVQGCSTIIGAVVNGRVFNGRLNTHRISQEELRRVLQDPDNRRITVRSNAIDASLWRICLPEIIGWIYLEDVEPGDIEALELCCPELQGLATMEYLSDAD